MTGAGVYIPAAYAITGAVVGTYVIILLRRLRDRRTSGVRKPPEADTESGGTDG